MSLTIKSGGQIVLSKYDEPDKDVTEYALSYLMEECVLDDDVTLRDIFLILQRDLSIYKMLIGNWVDEIVAEGLSGKPFEGDPEDCKIDYLELYWEMAVKIGKKPSFSGYLFPQFHGWGTWTDKIFPNQPDDYKGGIAVGLTPTYELIDIPVKLRPTATVTISKNYRQKNDDIQEYVNPEYSLFQILYAIIWELSFFGKPESRDKKMSGFKETIQMIKDDNEKFIQVE